MQTIHDQLVTLKTKKLAKEKGFNIRQTTIYTDGIEEAEYKGISQNLLLTWLREEYKIHIIIIPNFDNEGDEEENWIYQYISRYDNSLHDNAFTCTNDNEFDSYEEALEEALLVCLNLID